MRRLCLFAATVAVWWGGPFRAADAGRERPGATTISSQRSALSPPPFARAASVQARAPDPAREKRLEWFREPKYGLFIHWGLYAIPAGEWQGERRLGLGETSMFRRPGPGRESEKIASQVIRVKDNDGEW